MSLPFALGLYSVRTLYREDFGACLLRTAAMGYAGVECFGAPTLPAEDVRRALEESRLQLVGWHLPIESLEGDALSGTAQYLKAVGTSRAIVPFMPPETFMEAGRIEALADRMNAIQQGLTPHGIHLGYHNHEAEFVPLADGTLPWALLMDRTRLIPQLDTGNALASGTPGLDVSALVKRWPGRAETVHLKPYSRAKGFGTMIGEDDIDWPAFLAAAESAGCAWAIVEYEEEAAYGQFEGAEACLKALKALA